jgi:phage terminase large subunit GpA-like protein
MVTLADLVRNHLDQAKLPETHRTWVNTSLGLPYEEKGEAPEEDRVRALREGYRQGEIAEGVKRIVAGVDVQANRLVYVIRGFGMNLESWLVRHGELWGDTSQPFVWDQLQELLDSNLGTEENERRISLMAIDSGYRPDEVYRFCRKNPRRAVPTKGHDTQTKPLRASKVDVTIQGRLYPAGMQIWHLDSDYFKSWVHGRLEWEGESGRFRLPTDADDDYCKQLVAETLIVDERGRATWKKLRRDNHYLDCEALNSAAAHILQLHLLRPKAQQAEEDQPKKRRPRTKPTNWTTQW